MGKVKTIVLLHVILFFYSLAALVSKFASKEALFSIEFTILYGIVLFILFVYAILWQQILKKMNVSTAFANKAVTIIWGMVWGALLFAEKITGKMIIGTIIICIGIILVVKDD